MNQFPVGIHQFSYNKIVNFELNRWHAFGLARLEDLIEAAKTIKTIEVNKPAFWEQAKDA